MLSLKPRAFILVVSAFLAFSGQAILAETLPSEEHAIDFFLHGTSLDPEAFGFALFIEHDGEEFFAVELQGLSAATVVSIFVDGVFVNGVPVVEGLAFLELHSLEGDVIPAVTETSVVDVFAAGTENLLLSSEGVDLPPCELHEFVVDFDLAGTDAEPEAFGFAIYFEDCDQFFGIEVEGLFSTDAVLIFVDGEFVGDAPVIENFAVLELDSLEGDEVPELNEHSLIEVFAAGTGTLVLTTEFEDGHPCESEEFEIGIDLFGTELEPEAFGGAFYLLSECEEFLFVEIHHIQSTDGVLIFIDGAFVDDVPVEEGTAILDLDTLFGDEVPELTEHSVVEVFAAGSEELILSSEETDGTDGIDFAVDVHLVGTDADPEAEGIAISVVEGAERFFFVEIEGITAANFIDIFVNDEFVGFTVVEEGFAHLFLASTEGDAVPILDEHSVVEVRINDSDTVILSSHVVYVDFVDGHSYSSGGEMNPLDSLGTAIAIIQDNGVIKLSPGVSSETLVIDKPLRLEREGSTGSVIIGSQ